MLSNDTAGVEENPAVNTIHRIYRGGGEDLLSRDPANRRSFINRSQYAKLHRSFSSTNKRFSVGNLKGRYEDLQRQHSQEEDSSTSKFTPASFGYPKTAKLSAPLIKPKPSDNKDENSNNVVESPAEPDSEEVSVVLQPTPSVESVDKIAQELDEFEMDGGRTKDKKRGSFRRMFLGGLFAKDKTKQKRVEEEKKKKVENNDNLRNETSFRREGSLRAPPPLPPVVQEQHQRRMRDLEQEYARLNMERFQSIRQGFDERKTDNYVIMDQSKIAKPKTDFVSGGVNKFIDTTSSSESEKPARDTPPRAQETNHNIKAMVVTPKAYHGKESPRTIERNLNTTNNSKDYPDKAVKNPDDDDTYGTVFDSLVVKARPPVSPNKPLVESTKLRLPPNRQVYEPQPRVKSPIPANRVSTEKIIATELLKSTRSPTPPKRTDSVKKVAVAPPPPETHFDTVVQVHARRPSTPVELRMAVSSKMSPTKTDVRKSVEEYYWKQLKKLKEEEDSRLRSLPDNYDDWRLKRSRSLSPNRAGRRSLSLPRPVYVDYARGSPHQSIPEDQMVVADGRYYKNGNGGQRPIFRRGSLTKQPQEIYDPVASYNKRVSYAYQQQWPTRNGYTQNPPQRFDSETDDEVFLQEPYYVNRPPLYPSEPVYTTNRVLQQFRTQYPPPMGARRLSMDSLPPPPQHQQEQLYSGGGPRRPPFFQYNNNVQQMSLQRNNPVYSSRQSMTDSTYGQKQVTMRKRYCDIYGQIHDVPPPQSGVVMGQLQNNHHQRSPAANDGFVRGARLTSSANDIGRRQQRDFFNARYENRPLPPVPPHVSDDTESGSDATEVQRIMRNKTKRRALFGK